MERLTFDGLFCDIAKCQETPGGSFCENGMCSQRKVWERLKEYEDTGLTPEQVKDMADNAETRLLTWFEAKYGFPVGKLMDFCEAEEQGRLVVPVVRVGDTVWTNIAIQGDRYRKADRPYLTKVVYIGIGEGNSYFHVEYSNGRVFPFDFNKIGKTVFLTREEAEQVLEGKHETST